jgi:hypothetical protein
MSKINYIPCLRFKRGEKTALQHLSSAGKTNVLPLILIGSEQFKSKKATKTSPAIPAPVSVAQDIATFWGKGAFYLDASSILGEPGKEHSLVAIARECRALGLSLIPATHLDAPPEYQKGLAEVVATDKRGCSLKVDLQEMTSTPSWLSQWQVDLKDTDLLADLSDQAGVALALGPSLTHAFQNLHAGDKWRSVIVAGTSMPDNFSAYEAGAHKIARSEKALWEQLNSESLPYELSYGDYATVSTSAPPPGIRWGYPISVRYTLLNEFLICRGVRTRGMGAQDLGPQLVGHAASIVMQPSRGPLPGCWADSEIDSIAAKKKPPQGLEHWVAIGINRHIELTRSILS